MELRQAQNETVELNLDLWPKQLLAIESFAQEKFFGGSAGPGKSHEARVEAITLAADVPGIQVYFFRRFYDDLVLNHIEGPTGFRAILAPWIRAKLCQVVEGEIRFAWGSKIHLRHCQYERDLPRLLGPEIHALFLEEASQFTESMIRFIRGRLRIPKSLKIPDKYLIPKQYWRNPAKPEYSLPRAAYTSNPGNVGHAYLKRSFITGHEPYSYFRAPEDDGGMLRQFIPARLVDNPSIDQDQYAANLKGLGSPALVKALLEGDWDAVVGAFFPEIDPNKHLIKPIPIPAHWPRLMGMDWGACGEGDPFAIGWWAVASERTRAHNRNGEVITIPNNSLICYRRWYGKGLPKVTATQVAEGIRRREKNDETITLRVAGGDIDAKKGYGKTLLETFGDEDIHFMHADRRRQPGHMEYRERLAGKGEGPLIYYFLPFQDDLETIQNLQHDILNRNDCMDHEDHNYEADRYVCMARPMTGEKPVKAKTIDEIFSQQPTLNDLWKMKEALQRKGRR